MFETSENCSLSSLLLYDSSHCTFYCYSDIIYMLHNWNKLRYSLSWQYPLDMALMDIWLPVSIQKYYIKTRALGMSNPCQMHSLFLFLSQILWKWYSFYGKDWLVILFTISTNWSRFTSACWWQRRLVVSYIAGFLLWFLTVLAVCVYPLVHLLC